MSDDAEFDAFLNGDSDLARRLQGMAQPAPSAALDAAILASARAAMAQEARPAAANDSGDKTAAPRLAPTLGWRWRMPAGIAAAVLVGVFAKQSFEASSDLNQVALPAPAPVMSEAAPAPEIVMIQPEAARAAADAAPPVELQRQAPPPRAQSKPPAKVRSEAIPAQMKPEPSPVVVHESSAAAPPPVPVVVQARKSAPAVIADKAPKPANIDAYSAEKRAPFKLNYDAPPAALAPAPAPAAEAAAAPMERVEIRAAPNRQRDSLNASGAVSGGVASQRQALAEPPPAGAMAAKAWLDRIEKLLAQERQAEAVADWKAFREVYPNYPVPEATREKLE